MYALWMMVVLLPAKIFLTSLRVFQGQQSATLFLEKFRSNHFKLVQTRKTTGIPRLDTFFRELILRVLFLAESPLWWCYFAFLLSYISLPWYHADLFHGRSDPSHLEDEIGYVYLVGFWVAGRWQPVLDTWTSGFLDLWCWRFPVFIYLAHEVTYAHARPSGLSRRALKGKRSAVGWIVLAGVVVLWWLQWRIVAHGGWQVVWTGVGGVWWGIVETWWIYWGIPREHAKVQHLRTEATEVAECVTFSANPNGRAGVAAKSRPHVD